MFAAQPWLCHSSAKSCQTWAFLVGSAVRARGAEQEGDSGETEASCSAPVFRVILCKQQL